jgi:hypothetical protein
MYIPTSNPYVVYPNLVYLPILEGINEPVRIRSDVIVRRNTGSPFFMKKAPSLLRNYEWRQLQYGTDSSET